MSCPVLPVMASSLLFFHVANSQPACPAWQDAHTLTVEIGPADNLTATVQAAASGTTILLRAGTYRIAATVQFTRDDVTLRSLSGNRDDVILDGNGGAASPLIPANFVQEVVAVSASNVTLADLTIRHARYHGIHAYAPSGRGIENLRMRNIRVYDCSQQLIKVNSNGASPTYWVDNGILECSQVEFVDNSVMENQGSYFYTGGIDVHGGLNWIVRNNVFRNIQRNATLMEAAVHFWNKSRGTLIENNRFEDNHIPITLGMRTDAYTVERRYPDGRGDNPYLDHIDGVIRNNMIFNRRGVRLEAGMELTNIAGTEIFHNTVVSGDAPFSSVEYRWPDTRVTIANNLLSHNLRLRDGAQGTLQSNVTNAPSTLFVDATTGDLHLAPSAAQAINLGSVLAPGKAGVDFDGQARDAAPDIGADEYSASNPIFGSINIPRGRADRGGDFGTGFSLTGRKTPYRIGAGWYTRQESNL